MSYILLFLPFFFLIFLSEFLAYCWHRWGAHTDIIPNALGVQNTHSHHHITYGDSAYGDFFYILIFLIFYLVLILYLIQQDIISSTCGFIIYAPVLVVSFYNYFIHSAYHQDNHWLNKYTWFQNDKRIHFQHQVNK